MLDSLLARTLILLVFTVTPILTFAPPHHELYKDWESVHHYRRRLNITYGYKPKFISEEHCRFASEEECEQADFERGLAIAERRLNPSIGTFRVLVLLMYFPEADTSVLPPMSYFDTLFNGDGVSDINPVGSIREYFLYHSLGQYIVSYDLQDWSEAPNSAASYAGGTSGRNSNNLPLQPIFTGKLDSMVAAGFDLSPYDADGDGILDHLHIIHSGYPAELGDQYTCTSNVADMIWSQGSPSAPAGSWVSADGKYSLGGYTISSAFTFDSSGDVCSNTPTTMAVATHEYTHGFNVLDKYDTDYSEPVQGTGGLGAFDIMSFAYGWTADGAHPGHQSPYSRMECKWLTPLVISEDGMYAIQPAELSGQVYMITSPYPSGEYLTIELRYGIKWDDQMPAGIVIYHVDMNAGDATTNTIQSERGYPGHANWPDWHYRIAVQQADGRYDIEMMADNGNNRGDETDFWLEGMTLGPGPDTWPNTDSYQNGQVATGISITIVSATSYIMQFEVSGMGTGTRRAVESSTRSMVGNATVPNDFILDYVPYGNATLATPEQMKEFMGPELTKEALYQMFDTYTPGKTFDAKDAVAHQQQKKNQNIRVSSSANTLGGAVTGIVLMCMSFLSLSTELN